MGCKDMRTIKFRGKDCANEWVYGDLIHKRHDPGEVYIQDEKGLGSDVPLETVGQFTGLLDKDGKEIYEGDILEVTPTNGVTHSCVVNMCNHGYWSIAFNIHEKVVLGYVDRDKIRIIGNIYDNHDLLKGGTL